jgi:hypothetical protein
VEIASGAFGAHASAPQPPEGRRRHDAETRRAVLDQRNIDGEFRPAADELAGAVEGIHQHESATDIRGPDRGLFRYHRDAGQKTRQSFEDKRFCGFVRGRDW